MKYAHKVLIACLLAPAAVQAAPNSQVDFSKINRNLAEVVGVTMTDPEVSALFSQAQIAFNPTKSKVQACQGCDQHIQGLISVTARYSSWSKAPTSLQGNFDIDAKRENVLTTIAATLKTSTIDLTKFVFRYLATLKTNPCLDREFLQRNGREGQQFCANAAGLLAVQTFEQLADLLVKEADLANTMILRGTFRRSSDHRSPSTDQSDLKIWKQIYKGFVEYKTAPKRDTTGRKYISITFKPETNEFFGITGLATTYAHNGISLKVQFTSKRSDTAGSEATVIESLQKLETMDQQTRAEISRELKGFINYAKEIIFAKQP